MTATFRLAVVSSVVLMSSRVLRRHSHRQHTPLPFASSICSTRSGFKGRSSQRQPYGRRSGGSTGDALAATCQVRGDARWEPGPGVAGLAVKDGQLTGRVTSDGALIHLERTSGLDVPDTLHAIEVRMRASDGANVSIQTSPRDDRQPGRYVCGGAATAVAAAVAHSCRATRSRRTS